MALFSKLPSWASILITVIAAVIVVGLVSWGTYNLVKPAPSKLPGEKETECKNLWWYDDEYISCQQPKQFCGSYMYQGLETFETKEACENSLSDETANWKTYRNEEYGFEVKYPNDWLIEGNQDSVYFKRTDISQEEMEGRQIGYPLMILVKNTTAKSVLAWFESEFSDRSKGLKPEKTMIKIGGLDGVRFSDPISMGGCNEDFVMIKDGKLFKFLRHGSTCTYSDELFTKILSTFKFIE